MSEFYELKRKGTKSDKDNASYWKERCKASEAQVQELTEALIVSNATIKALEKTLHAIDKALKLMGLRGVKGKTLIEKMLTTGVIISKVAGQPMTVETLIDDEKYEGGPIAQLNRLDGVDIELTPLGGLYVEPHFEGEGF